MLNYGSILRFSIQANSPLNRFKEISSFFENLYHNTSLTSLDISGHLLGNSCAIALSRFLEVNHTLRSLNWDENNTTVLGLKNFVRALETNQTLQICPLPLIDILKIQPTPDSKIPQLLETIEAKLSQNRRKCYFLDEVMKDRVLQKSRKVSREKSGGRQQTTKTETRKSGPRAHKT